MSRHLSPGRLGAKERTRGFAVAPGNTAELASAMGRPRSISISGPDRGMRMLVRKVVWGSHSGSSGYTERPVRAPTAKKVITAQQGAMMWQGQCAQGRRLAVSWTRTRQTFIDWAERTQIDGESQSVLVDRLENSPPPRCAARPRDILNGGEEARHASELPKTPSIFPSHLEALTCLRTIGGRLSRWLPRGRGSPPFPDSHRP
jgi:hypothetical protein